jgi:hypothetical protein
LSRQKEEGLDWFRDREAREAARQAALDEAERLRQSQEWAESERRYWEDEWITHALNYVPPDAPRELGLQVHNEVAEALSRLQPNQSEVAVRRIVEAAAEKALAPWRIQTQRRQAIDAALGNLPFHLRYNPDFADQKHEATRLAAAAVTQCPPGAPYELLVSAATQAVKPVMKAVEHAQTCKEIVAWVLVRGGSLQDLVEARELVTAALANLPVGCSRAQLERVRDEALAPILARNAEHDRAEAARAEEQRRRNNAEWRVDLQLGHIERYLNSTFEYEGYAGIYQRSDDARRLKEKIRPILIAECIADESLDAGEIRSRIEELVEENI